jgi:K+-transporting ATPase KdpF subunit
MKNCAVIKHGRTSNMFVSVSMAKASSPCDLKWERRISGMGAAEVVAGLIGLALLVYLAYALVFPEKF